MVKRLMIAAMAMSLVAVPAAHAKQAGCKLTPKEVATRFMTEFYIDKKPRQAFETWVDPAYIQHNPLAATGRDAAIAFLEPFMANNPGVTYSIKRIIADGDLVAVHSQMKMSPEDRGFAVVDIIRIKGCKVMEHWDVIQQVPEKSANANTMF